MNEPGSLKQTADKNPSYVKIHQRDFCRIGIFHAKRLAMIRDYTADGLVEASAGIFFKGKVSRPKKAKDPGGNLQILFRKEQIPPRIRRPVGFRYAL